MTETEKKALALVRDVADGYEDVSIHHVHNAKTLRSALCRAIEDHETDIADLQAEYDEVCKLFEAFKREVSDAVAKTANAVYSDSSLIVWSQMRRFIIPKLDPLVEAMRDACGAQGIATKHTPGELTKHFRTALAARGGRIVWEGE